MELHGSTEDNLMAAIRSARRLRAYPVYAETLDYWNDLLHEARHELSTGKSAEAAMTQQLVVELELELAERTIRP